MTCEGPVKASSESLTHAILYKLSNEINAVIHTHHRDLWNHLLHQLPTTSKNISYGTPKMVFEVKRLFDETDLSKSQIFVMAGHKDGIVAFGKNLNEAVERLLSLFHRHQKVETIK